MADGDRMVAQGDSESLYAYRHLDDIVRPLANMPGQRVLVLVSPGFIPSTLQSDVSEMVDRATRANIVINTMVARGLSTPDVSGDIANPPRDSIGTAGSQSPCRVEPQWARRQVLSLLARAHGRTL